MIGYSGHAFVVCDIFLSSNIEPVGYFEASEKRINPYHLEFYGSEKSNHNLLKDVAYFVALGSNIIRRKVTQTIVKKIGIPPINAIHNLSSISSTATIGEGVMVGNGTIINACCHIGNGVICNTQAVIEHECRIGMFSHIAPGAVLCGNVTVGENTFIGARTVVKQGVTIGDNVIVGAGTVVIKDIPSNSKVVGNPQKFI